MAGYSQVRFLVLVHESLGIDFSQALDSSYSLIESMMQEYAYLCNERNKTTKDEDEGIEGKDYEWIELPSFDDPSKTIRMKRCKDSINL